MAAKDTMEHLPPTFISREQREHIEFYQDWVRTAFLEGLSGLDTLIQLRDRFTLSHDDLNDIKFRDLDLDLLHAAAEEIRSKIIAEAQDAARDLQRNVFDAGLFRVGVVVEDKVLHVEGVSTDGECVIPVIEGEPYAGAIDDVLFDR